MLTTHDPNRANLSRLPSDLFGTGDARISPEVHGLLVRALRADGDSESRTAGDAGICFTIPGAIVGKGRHRSRIAKMRDGRQFIANYTPKETASYENLIKTKAEQAMDGKPLFAGAVAMTLFAFVSPPASWSLKKKRMALAGEIHPTTKPDLDNVLKSICDGCNGVVFADDKQVVAITMRKRYAATPGAHVEVRAL